MKYYRAIPLILLLGTTLLAQSHPPVHLYGVDSLGRRMPAPSDVRAFRADRYVGIFYFLWLHQDQVYDNSKILEQAPSAITTNASPPWGPPRRYHFWGEPLFGYYRSDDPWVLRKHAMLLADAGVDFLVFDTTNAVIYEKVVMQLCSTFDQLRRAGERVPQFTFMVNSRAGQTAERIYNLLYKPGRYPELWFRWKGKPLLICDPAEASDEVARFFTLRKAHWPFQLVNTQNAWHWEATYPQVYSYDRDPARAEQVSVSVAQNLHWRTGRVEMMSTGEARGRSFHGGQRDPRPDAYRLGLNFQEQWDRALQLDPEVVFLTGWNEWIALQLNTKPGRPVFCDQFNLEFSRDAEMMKGGYGDNFYMQMAENIRRFKGMSTPSPSSPPKTIDLSRPFSQWADVQPAFHDHALDVLPRDFPGCGDHHYRVDSGRNDFRVLKVTQDRDYLYFYAQTASDITPRSDPNWMWLLLDVDGDPTDGWQGFDFLVNRQVANDQTASLEANAGGWQWKPAGDVAYRRGGRELHLRIAKQRLGIRSDRFSVDFKWIDNTQSPGDVMDLYVHGDSAPEGRFRYRYRSADIQEW